MLFKLKGSAGTSTHGYKLSLNRFKMGISRFLTMRTARFWLSLSIGIVGAKILIASETYSWLCL